jgi:hypothetical protein
MKNSINLVAAILFFIVLGCGCPRLDNLAKKEPPPAPPPPTNGGYNATNTSRTPGSASSLTMSKYNELKNNMTKTDVERLLGGPGEEVSSSSGGGYTYSVYKWSGENFAMIIVTFQNDKLQHKSQFGLK